MAQSVQPEFAAVLVAALALGGAGAWLVLGGNQASPLREPRTQDKPIAMVSVSLPAVGGRQDYYINEDNPFLPYALRQLAEQSQPDHQVHTPSGRRPGPPPPAPPWPPPPLAVTGPSMPQAYGVVRSADAVQVLVHVPPALQEQAGITQDDIVIAPGATLGGWTLVEVDIHGQALWRDAQGGEHRVPIGPQTTVRATSATSASGAPASGTPAPTAKGGKYVVQPGDTPQSLYAKIGGDLTLLRRIADLNPQVDFTQLKPGDVLDLPADMQALAPVSAAPQPAPAPQPMPQPKPKPKYGAPKPGSVR